MNLSLNWLSDFIDLCNITPHDFASAMTLSGSKVEKHENTAGLLQNIVVGKILKIEKHPDADKLLVCEIDIGSGKRQIVTGANNVKAGDIVPVCLDGAVTADGSKIKTGKLRGVLSEGMLCSIEELGLTENDYPGADNNGILILDDSFPLGKDIKDALLLNDVAVEFEITSNRPDCLSVIGLAIEAGATFGKEVKITAPQVKGGGGNDKIKVSVAEPSLCPRYAAKIIKNIIIGPSPLWLRMRLRAAGVRPINNIVDITNYVMIEYGQPMHAFDRSYISGDEIIVRRATEGEKITTLDEKEHTLSSENLMICDADKPIAVAGVMGGQNSEINENTKEVVFECANFAPTNVRKTAKKLGIRTESSARFEKGLDPGMVIDALDRACELVELLGCGVVSDITTDIDNSPKLPKTVSYSPEYVNAFLGTDIDIKTMENILASLKFEVSGNTVTVPGFRIDVEDKADIAEEIARIYGYDKIPTTVFKSTANTGGLNAKQRFEKNIASSLISCGLSEIYTLTFASNLEYDKINMPKEHTLRNSVRILNPFGEETSLMRTTPIPAMLDILGGNYAKRTKSAGFFEIAKVFLPVPGQALPNEKKTVIIGLYGTGDYYYLKGIVEKLFCDMGYSLPEFARLTDHFAYHPGKSAKITIDGKNVGHLGELHPGISKNYDIKLPVYIAELDFDALFSARTTERKFVELPKYPATTRDLALLCDESVLVADIEKIFKKCGGANLASYKLFDIYRSEQIGENKKSVAYSLSLRALDRTLTDAEVDKIISKIIVTLEKDLSVTQR